MFDALIAAHANSLNLPVAYADGAWHLIAAIHFNAGRVFVRAVLTHREYDKGGWK